MRKSEPIDVLIIGAGMYVCGKGTTGFGTIMPAVLEGGRRGLIGRIGLATRSESTCATAKRKIEELIGVMRADADLGYFVSDVSDVDALLRLLDEFKPQAAIVSLPDHLHANVTIPIVSRGIHCLTVKPMATTLNEAKAMASAARKAKVVAQVEFHKRLDESNRLLRDRVRSGAIGELLYAVIEYSQQKQIPRDLFRSWSSKTNIFQYLGVHYVDLLQFATGYVARRVTAWGQKEYLAGLGINTWDSIQAVISWEKPDGNSFVSTHITNWIDPDETSAMSDQKINVVGTRGRYQADQKHRGVQMVLDGRGVEDINPYFSVPFTVGTTGRVSYQGYGINSVLQFLDDVKEVSEGSVTLETLQQERPSFEACQVSTAVVEAVTRSLLNDSTTIEVAQ